MKIHKIEWFDEFRCAGGSCPQTCCKGWLIPLDEDDLARYSHEKGRLGLSLLAATAGFTRTRINLFSGECRYHTREGLCSLQLKKGHDFIPWACRSFPRFYRNYGEFEERYLDLSCIEAAKVFIRNADKLRIFKEEGVPETKPCTTNDDREYLETLLNIRRDIIEVMTGAVQSVSDKNNTGSGAAASVINNGLFQETKRGKRDTVAVSGLANTMHGRMTGSLYSYACMLQDMYARGGTGITVPMFSDYLKDIETSGSSVISGLSDIRVEDDTAENPKKTTEHSSQTAIYQCKEKCFPFSLSLLGRLTESLLYYFGQKKTGTELYSLLIKARSFTAGYRRDEDGFAERIRHFFAANPVLQPLLIEYLTYYLYQYFLEAYETYSFRKITALGIIHTNMILFLAVVAEDKRYMTGELAHIIAIYNRKAYFNETIQNDLYRIFEEEAYGNLRGF